MGHGMYVYFRVGKCIQFDRKTYFRCDSNDFNVILFYRNGFKILNLEKSKISCRVAELPTMIFI